MNGEPLPREHGFPARLVTPGLYGFVGATKWLERLTVTTYADRAGLLDPPGLGDRRPDQAVQPDRHPPAAVADPSPDATPSAVSPGPSTSGSPECEVRIDGGPWQDAVLGPDAGIDYWRQWYLPWDAAPGSHMVAVRARPWTGRCRPPPAPASFPDGSSGIQEIVLEVGR